MSLISLSSFRVWGLEVGSPLELSGTVVSIYITLWPVQSGTCMYQTDGTDHGMCIYHSS